MNNPQVAYYVQALKDKDENVREQAAEALGEIRDATGVPALIDALKDKDENVREQVARALGNIGDAAAVPALIEALKNADEHVRMYAASALGKFGDATAVPALMEALKDENRIVRGLTTEALEQIGDVAAVPALIKALKDKDVRKQAANALGKIGDSQTLPRKILAASPFSAQQKIEVLDALRQVLGYRFPDTSALCQMVLAEEDSDARIGAQAVLNLLACHNGRMTSNDY
jgi:HEAT repeat protein